MENQLSADARKQLDRFCREYLQVQLQLSYPSPSHLRNDSFQRSLHSRLFQDGALQYTPPQRYQLRVLKELTKRIEDSIQDWEEEGISDDLMNCLTPLLSSSLPSEATATQTKSYVTYTLSFLGSEASEISDDLRTRVTQTVSKSEMINGTVTKEDEHPTTLVPLDTGKREDPVVFPTHREPPTITLLESRNLLAASGVTGFRTWEASLHLSRYLCSPDCHFPIRKKRILELGAGTGLISILCAKYLGASHILSTDGSSDIVSSLETNFYLNGLQDEKMIEAKELKWGHALVGGEEREWNGGKKVDLVLGADLTYDSSNHPALVATFGELFDIYAEVKVLIAATVRNVGTHGEFLGTCKKAGLSVEEIEFEVLGREEQEGPFYEDGVPIKVCWISRGG